MSMEAFVAVETRVLIQSVPKPNDAFPHPNNATLNLNKTVKLASDVNKFKGVDNRR